MKIYQSRRCIHLSIEKIDRSSRFTWLGHHKRNFLACSKKMQLWSISSQESPSDLRRFSAQFHGYEPGRSWSNKKSWMRLKMLATHKSLSHICHTLLCSIPNQTMVCHRHMKPRDTYYIYCKMSVQNFKSLSLSIASKTKKTEQYSKLLTD